MRNGQNKQRMRNRNNNNNSNNNNNNHNRRGQNPMTRVYESNGPDIKIRGTASHIAEKYLQLARVARSASGDPVAAENYYQHAEHYFRLIATAQEQFRQNQQPRGDEPVSSSSDDGDIIDVSHVYDFNKLPLQDRARPYRVSRREQRDRRREQSDLPSRESWHDGHHVGISTFSVESSERRDRRSGSRSRSSSRGGHDYDDDDHRDGADDDDDILGRSDDDDNENDDDDIFPFELSSSDLDTSSVTATKKIFRHSFDTSDLDSSSANDEGSSELRK